VHGAADLSAQDPADILGRLLGKPVRYQQIPLEALRETFLKRGASPLRRRRIRRHVPVVRS